MITISTNVAVGAGSIVMFAGFMLGYATAWRQRLDERPSGLQIPDCEMPLQADELERLRLYRLMNPAEPHP